MHFAGRKEKKNPDHVYSPIDWNDEMAIPYSRGKTLSEKLLWELSKEHPQLEVVSLNPGVTIGPILTTDKIMSMGNLISLLDGSLVKSGANAFVFSFTYLCDLSEAALKSLVSDFAVGKRFLFCQSRSNFSGLKLARIVEDLYPGKFLLPDKNKGGATINYIENSYDNSLAIELMGRPFTTVEESLRDTVNNLLELGVVKFNKNL